MDNKAEEHHEHSQGEYHEEHTSSSATVNTGASVMGYRCRFFCSCKTNKDVVDPVDTKPDEKTMTEPTHQSS